MKHASTLFIFLTLCFCCYADTTFIAAHLVIPDTLSLKYPVQPEKSFFRENPSAVVSICALIFTFLSTLVTLAYSTSNLKRQLKVQRATTIEKDWINDIRTQTAALLYQSKLIFMYTLGTRSNPSSADEVFSQFLNTTASLDILLDKKVPVQKKLLQAIDLLKEKVINAKNKADFNELLKYSESVVTASHELFQSFKENTSN